MMKKSCFSRYSVPLSLTAIFLGLLVLNYLTPYVADDYVYMVSFDTKALLSRFSDLFPSMYVHCHKMNGRVVSHFLEQVFMLLGKPLFNLCNGLAGTLLVYWMYRISGFGQNRSCLLLWGITMGIWCSMPVFGQVFLWQVGALNYLWALTGGIGFLLPFLVRFLAGRDVLSGAAGRMAFCLCAILFGMYSEITSFVCIYLAAALLVLGSWWKKHSFKTWLWLGIICACTGYMIMLCMPAQLPAKSVSGLSFSLLWANALRATGMLLRHCWHLLLIWSVSFVLGWRNHIGADRLVLSLLFLTGALGGNYMTVIATYYPERCLCTTVMLLILSICLLLAPLGKKRMIQLSALALLLVFAVSFGTGFRDILDCWQQNRAREFTIAAQKAQGNSDLELDLVIPSTPYSAFWDLRDLSTEDAATWPNSSMAKYYGVSTILGSCEQPESAQSDG